MPTTIEVFDLVQPPNYQWYGRVLSIETISYTYHGVTHTKDVATINVLCLADGRPYKKKFQRQIGVEYLKKVFDFPPRYFDGPCPFAYKKKGPTRPKKEPRYFGRNQGLLILEGNKKRDQLRKNGNYPRVYAIRFIQHSPKHCGGSLTWEQAREIFYEVTTDWDGSVRITNQKLVVNLAEKQIERMIMRMQFAHDRDRLQ